MQEGTKTLENLDLPTAEAIMRVVPEDTPQIIVATDSGRVEFKRFSDGRKIRSSRPEDPQVNAIVDMALCIGAERFIGTGASTFTAYVAYAHRA